jgi:curved DNA-binding protein CbpA
VRPDPHRVLGVPPDVSSEDLHDAYRRLVKLHHPDRNGGSVESTQRFKEIQEAYDELRNRPQAARRADTSVEDRMTTLERELREAHAARERARRAAREAARGADAQPAADASEDSFGRILSDVRDELGDRLSAARRHPAVERVSDLIDGLEDLASRLDRSPRS